MAVPFGPWQQVLERLEQLNGALYGALCGSNAYECEGYCSSTAKPHVPLPHPGQRLLPQSIRQAVMEVTGLKAPLGACRNSIRQNRHNPILGGLFKQSVPAQESVEIL